MNKIVTKPDASVFTDREKEAKYWENNFDTAWEKGKPAHVSFARNLSETLNIRLDPDTLTHVKKEAKKKGLGPTQLIRMWIMEKMSSTTPAVT
jgi:predicted DNA binding CopG/RHH family protein